MVVLATSGGDPQEQHTEDDPAMEQRMDAQTPLPEVAACVVCSRHEVEQETERRHEGSGSHRKRPGQWAGRP